MKVSPLHRRPVALAAALVIAASAGTAFAQPSKDQAAAPTATQPAGSNAAQPAAKAAMPAPLSAQDREVMKLSQEGFNAMRAVRAARIAIFNGNPQAAHDLLGKAESSLQAASKDATSLQAGSGPGQSSSGSASSSDGTKSADYIPIDGQIMLVDAFVDSPAKKGHIDKANQHIAKGDSKAALDELRLAEVGASFTRVLLPLQPTRTHVEAASRLLEQKKFYEANLALKAAEDGILVDTVMLTEAPKPGANPATGKAAGKSAG